MKCQLSNFSVMLVLSRWSLKRTREKLPAFGGLHARSEGHFLT